MLEESGIVEGTDKSHTWYIDPLDGTTNFLHGLPIFAISIGLAREGQIVAGLIYNPATEDMYIAEKGQGAYHNNRRLRVAARRNFGDALIGCGVPHPGKKGHVGFRAEFAAVMARASNLRRSAPPRSTSVTSRKALTTGSGSANCNRGTSRPVF